MRPRLQKTQDHDDRPECSSSSVRYPKPHLNPLRAETGIGDGFKLAGYEFYFRTHMFILRHVIGNFDSIDCCKPTSPQQEIAGSIRTAMQSRARTQAETASETGFRSNRPKLWYSNPIFFIASGDNILRASSTSGRAISA